MYCIYICTCAYIYIYMDLLGQVSAAGTAERYHRSEARRGSGGRCSDLPRVAGREHKQHVKKHVLFINVYTHIYMGVHTQIQHMITSSLCIYTFMYLFILYAYTCIYIFVYMVPPHAPTFSCLGF